MKKLDKNMSDIEVRLKIEQIRKLYYRDVIIVTLKVKKIEYLENNIVCLNSNYFYKKSEFFDMEICRVLENLNKKSFIEIECRWIKNKLYITDIFLLGKVE